MLKYVDTKVVFQEIPNEISLAINISGCPVKCKDCHSKYLWENIGEPLTYEALNIMIEANSGITCILFMGGDCDTKAIYLLSKYVKKKFHLKTAWYSGRDRLENLDVLDYIKIGPYIEEFGPLNRRTTNQRLYKIEKSKHILTIKDITKLMQK